MLCIKGDSMTKRMSVAFASSNPGRSPPLRARLWMTCLQPSYRPCSRWRNASRTSSSGLRHHHRQQWAGQDQDVHRTVYQELDRPSAVRLDQHPLGPLLLIRARGIQAAENGLVKCCDEEFRLGAEGEVDGLNSHSRLLGDRAHRGALVAAFGEKGSGGGRNAGAGLLCTKFSIDRGHGAWDATRVLH